MFSTWNRFFRRNGIIPHCWWAALLLFVLGAPGYARETTRCNFVFVLCDDLGYGDVRCLNPEGKIPTPSLDRLAKEGMAFTDAHSPSSVCSPTRYGLLTGRYAWRSRLQQGVLGGLSPRLIEPGRLTVAEFLRKQGYHTACIGKWHLGMNWVKRPGKEVTELNIEPPEQVWNVDYSQPIADGPNSVGFDYYFGISASLDMVPYTFIENDRIVAPTEVEKQFPLMLGRPESQTRKGPAAKSFEAEQVLPTLTSKAIEYIAQRVAASRQGTPFFLYLPLASPHTPIAPTAAWQGKSGLNHYADFVMETDDSIGRVLAALEEHGLAENTLVIVTSDNGCSPQAQFEELLAKGHNPNYHFRGAKADIYEGGHRVPMLVRWPGKVRPGVVSSQLVCLTDFFATCADILGQELPPSAAEDSISFLPALRETTSPAARTAIVHHSIAGAFAIREGGWKLALCSGSGGWSEPRPGTPAAAAAPPVQLYDLAGGDIDESSNLQADHPQVVERLTQLLERYVAEGRSTPGEPQRNAVEIELRK